MNIEVAKKIKEALDQGDGLKLTLIEIQSMTKITTTGFEVYALQRWDVTFLVLITGNTRIIVRRYFW